MNDLHVWDRIRVIRISLFIALNMIYDVRE